MALLDLSLVTTALIQLVREHVSASPVWGGTTPPNVTPLSPDRLPPGALGIYLYHIAENAHYKNQPPNGISQPPIRFTPMGLDLYYHLSARSADDQGTAVLQSQLLFGAAVKAIHDNPVINDETVINNVRILQSAGMHGENNSIRLSLQTMAPNEAVNFWTAGTAPIQLSAYYLASVTLLEEDEPNSRAGRVLSFGVHTFTSGAPRLESSHNSIEVTLPDSVAAQTIEMRPAQVSVGSIAYFTGVDLLGDETRLLLRSNQLQHAFIVDASWGVSASPNQVRATVQESADGNLIIPGIYSAHVQVIRNRAMPDGSTRTFESSSNETPFMISPRIDSVSVPDANGLFSVTGFVFQHDDLDSDHVKVHLGSSRLSRNNGDTPLARGEFIAINPNTINVRIPQDFPSGVVPLRIIVNRSESEPQWMTIS